MSSSLGAMWILFVLGSLAAVVSQIADRVQYFYSWPVNVNVKVDYNSSLRFPAVTICNQNAFRASQAAKHGLYGLVEELYANDRNITKSTFDRFNATHYTIEDLYTLLSHQKEDLIVKCMWRNRRCGPDDFRTILTDHGVCFVFSKNESDMLVSASGAGSGLQLVLNVEQYEYMPGPHGAAGVKVLLHNAQETPLVYELGEAIPTGAHAFLGIQTLTIDNIPKPYGECENKTLNHTSFYSMDECYLDCFAKFAESRCGCRDMHVPSLAGSLPVCLLEDYFSCFKGLRELFDKQYLGQCPCPVPCHVTQYGSTLSYATISNYMVNKLIPKSSESMLKEKLLRASESAQRYDQIKYYHWKNLYDVFVFNFERIKTMVRNVSNHIKVQIEAVEKIGVDTETVYVSKEKLYNYQEYVIEKDFLRVREAMEERTLRNLVDAFVEFTIRIKRQVIRLTTLDINEEKGRYDLYSLIIDSIVVRKEINELARENITELVEAFYNGSRIFNYSFEDIPKSHNDYIVPRLLFRYALKRTDYINGHLLKLQFRVFDDIKDSLDMMMQVVATARYSTSVNETELNNVMESFITACKMFMFSKSVVFTEILDYPLKVIKEKNYQLKTSSTLFNSVHSVLEQNIQSLSLMSDNVSQRILPAFEILIRQIQTYFHNSDLQFMEITEPLLAGEINDMVRYLDALFETLQTKSQLIRDSWYIEYDAIMDLWEKILNDEDMVDYYRFANLTEFLQPYTNVEKNWKDVISPFTDTEITNQVTNKGFDAAFGDIQEYAKEFREQFKLDTDFVRQNYLQVDIFFRHLSYDKVKQQAAYDIFALFCDIGGTMGLFIGASILTVIEVIELCLTQISTCRLFQRSKKFYPPGNMAKLKNSS